MTKIMPEHLARTAFIYVRQSTADQVLNHHESRRRQYALVDRARALGWDAVEVIDDDLGRSGSGIVHISAQTACDFGLIRPPVSGQFAQRFRRFRHPFRSNPPQLWVEGRGV
jgi:hypothetical protein